MTADGNSLMILIAGPYRGGTNDQPHRMRENLRVLTAAALPLFRAGHIPLIGEWLALPLLEVAGATQVGDELWQEIVYPIAHRLLMRCDAVLRLPGESKGADNDVRVALERGLPVYYRAEDVPACGVADGRSRSHAARASSLVQGDSAAHSASKR